MPGTVLVVRKKSSPSPMSSRCTAAGRFPRAHRAHGAEAKEAAGRSRYRCSSPRSHLARSDGVDLLREIRARRSIPVIMVTARGSEADRILGLELGADDYVTKPFSPRELVARVRAVLRRHERSEGSDASPISSGDLRLDPVSREVTLAGEPVDLTRKEFDLLAYLVGRPGRVLTRAQLLEAGVGLPGDVIRER